MKSYPIKRLPAGTARRFERFDPKIHKEKDRDPYFQNYVEIQPYIRTKKSCRMNPKYADAPYEVGYITSPEYDVFERNP